MSDDLARHVGDVVTDAIARREELSRQIFVRDGAIIIDVKRIMAELHPEGPARGDDYNVELSRCKDYGQVIGWVHHLCGKTWMSPERIRKFIDVALKANELALPWS